MSSFSWFRCCWWRIGDHLVDRGQGELGSSIGESYLYPQGEEAASYMTNVQIGSGLFLYPGSFVIQVIEILLQSCSSSLCKLGFEKFCGVLGCCRDNHMLLQILLLLAAHSWLPGFSNLPIWNMKGLAILFLLHVGPVEFLYYWMHRAFHSEPLFQRYHSFHHMSVVTEPPTGQFLFKVCSQLLGLLICIVPSVADLMYSF